MAADDTTPEKRRPGRPARTEAQRAEHRRRLVIGCMAGIRRHGADLSMDQMADAAGVSKPVLYAEFGDRNGVAEALALELASAVERRVLDGARDTGFDIRGALLSVIDALFDLVSEDPALYAFMVRALRRADRNLLENALVSTLVARAEVVVRMIARDVDPDVLRLVTHGVFGFVLAVMESWQLNRTPGRDEVVAMLGRVIDTALSFVEEGRLVLDPDPIRGGS